MFDFESFEVQQTLWAWFVRIVVLCNLANFGFIHHQILAYTGDRGLYPMKDRYKMWKEHFSLGTRLKHSPSTWLASLPSFLFGGRTATESYNGRLMLLVYLGLGAIASILIADFNDNRLVFELSLAAMWFLHITLSEINFLFFPWHSMINECNFIATVAHLPCLADPTYAVGALPSLAIRVLLFRIMIGFGKQKFIGATRKDIMYIKPFLIAVPFVSRVGFLMHTTLPAWFFKIGYVFFFISETVVPFMFFSPVLWHRTISGGFTVGLMMGIQVGANFGNFNFLTSAAATLAPLPMLFHATAPAHVGSGGLLAHVSSAILIVQMILGLMCLPFNSWVQYAWHMWPAFRVAKKVVTDVLNVFELCAEWRLAHAYGIFPPNTFPPQRQVAVFEGSDDGKTWKAFRYRYQLTREDDAPKTLPGLHPFLDFSIFYQGTFGFTRSIFTMTEFTGNLHCRLVDAVGRNLLEGGDVYKLFGECPFTQEKPPRYVRAQYVCLRPVVCSDAEFGKKWWHVTRGQMDLPPTSLETVHRIPKAGVSSVHTQLDYSNRVWRQRAVGVENADLWDRTPEKVAKHVQKTLDALKKFRNEKASKHALAIMNSAGGAKTLDEAARLQDQRQKPNKAAFEIDEQAVESIHETACAATDRLIGAGHPYSGEHPNDKNRVPTSTFQTHLLVLWLLTSEERLNAMTPEKLAQSCLDLYAFNKDDRPYAHDDKDPSRFVHDGLKLFVTMFARSSRLEASLSRRMVAGGTFKLDRMEDRGADALIPGWTMFIRAVFTQLVSFEWDQESDAFGKEVLFHFKFNDDTLLHEYVPN